MSKSYTVCDESNRGMTILDDRPVCFSCHICDIHGSLVRDFCAKVGLDQTPIVKVYYIYLKTKLLSVS